MSCHGRVDVAQWATANALLICFLIAPSVGNAASTPATDTLQAMKVSEVVTDDQEDDVSAFRFHRSMQKPPHDLASCAWRNCRRGGSGRPGENGTKGECEKPAKWADWLPNGR